MMADAHIQAENLSIRRGERMLFRGVSLSVFAGDAVLLRGENGAGKTTLLRCLAGLSDPETGRCSRAAFHWIGHRSGVKPHETPANHLQTWATAYGALDGSLVAAVVEKMGLARAKNVSGAHLSAGQRRRIALGRTQLTRYPVWLLDEPFAALDADGRALLGDLIAEHRQSGGSIVAAVHGDVPISNVREVIL